MSQRLTIVELTSVRCPLPHELLISEMTCCVSSGTLDPTHSLMPSTVSVLALDLCSLPFASWISGDRYLDLAPCRKTMSTCSQVLGLLVERNVAQPDVSGR